MFDKEENKGFDSSWDEVLKDYRVYYKVGQGTFSKVYKAKNKKTGLKVAIKHLTDVAENEYALVKLLREIKILRQI